MRNKVIALRMERQHLTRRASESEYLALYRDLQPGKNVYWNGFGQPPTLSFRADFDDLEFNRDRQADRALLKGRFGGGNLGWIVPEDLELFAALYRKPLDSPTENQRMLLHMIENGGPWTIRQMKEETGLTISAPRLCGVKQFPIDGGRYLVFLFRTDRFDGVLRSSEEGKMEWIPRNHLGAYPCVDDLEELLQVCEQEELTEFRYTVENNDWKVQLR